jgi:hypothetical protein
VKQISPSPWEILDISRDTELTPATIDAAYKKALRSNHPDLNEYPEFDIGEIKEAKRLLETGEAVEIEKRETAGAVTVEREVRKTARTATTNALASNPAVIAGVVSLLSVSLLVKLGYPVAVCFAASAAVIIAVRKKS